MTIGDTVMKLTEHQNPFFYFQELLTDKCDDAKFTTDIGGI